jgi:peptidoglycan hydrolase CwlO-like protein
MATKARSQSTTNGGAIQFPESLTLKDLVTIVSVAISLTVAWGVFSTRIALVEKEIVAIQAAMVKKQTAIERMQTQTRRLEAHQQDDEMIIDQIYSLLKRHPPIRRADP